MLDPQLAQPPDEQRRVLAEIADKVVAQAIADGVKAFLAQTAVRDRRPPCSTRSPPRR